MKLYQTALVIGLCFLCTGCTGGSRTDARPKSTETTQTGVEQAAEKPVLGWHRAKIGHHEYDYSVINMLAWFSYKVNPATGENQHPESWSTDPVIDSALAHKRKVYLTITNFGFSKNSDFLNNNDAVDALIKNVSSMIRKRDANGVCVDFEEIHQKDKKAYNQFVEKLSLALDRIDKEVIVVLPIYYPENVIDPKKLDGLVDYYVMMGYASHHLASSHAGPLSPWNSGQLWNPYSLERNVDQYLENSFKPSQFMVALPLYGIIWETASPEVPTRSIKGAEQPAYNAIMNRFKGQTPQIEPISQSSYFAYKEDGKLRQCWFESEENILRKIELLLAKNIAGIGFWALDYASDHPDLWKSIGTAVNREATTIH